MAKIEEESPYMSNQFVKLTNNIKTKFEKFQELSYKDKKTLIGNYLLNNSLYIFMIFIATIYIQIKRTHLFVHGDDK